VNIPELGPEPANRREIAFFALALAGLIALMLFLSDGAVLFTRPFWVDELLTVFVAQRRSPVGVIADLGHGADGGASLLHLTVWGLRMVMGSLTPTTLRALSLLCVFGALVLVYSVLRRRFGREASVAGVLAAGAHNLVVAHSFEARFYGPWLLCSALVAWLLSLNQNPARPRRHAIALAAAAVLLCTVHFYGIISLGLMSAAVLVSYGKRWREAVRTVLPTAAGLLSLVIVVPLALAQREAYTVPSWLPDFEFSQVASLARDFWLATVPLLGAILVLVGFIGHSRRDDGAAALSLTRAAAHDAGVVALLSLALMPLALALLSVLGQPSMLSRYAITAALAWAPWVALACALTGPWPTRVLLLVFVWLWFARYTREAQTKTMFAMGVDRSAQAYQQARSSGLPIVFQSIHVMYPLIAANGGREAPGAFLEIPDSTFHALFRSGTRLSQINRGIVLERDLARVHAVRFGFPRLVARATLDTTARFLLLAPEERLPAGFAGVEHFAKVLFPGHRVTRLLPDLSVVERSPAGPPSK